MQAGPSSRLLATEPILPQRSFYRAVVPKPFCDLRPGEAKKPLPYDLAEAANWAATLTELAEGSGLSRAKIEAFTRAVHAAGVQDKFDLLSTTSIKPGGVQTVIFLPCQLGTPPLASGQAPTEAEGAVYTYVMCHGTDLGGAAGIQQDRFARPSTEDLSRAALQEIVPVNLYGATAPGTWTRECIEIVLDQCLRKPKGRQGYLVLGTMSSRTQRYKVQFQQTAKEHEITFSRGLVRAPSRWGRHVSHFNIKGFGLLVD